MSTFNEEMDYSDGEEEYLEVATTRKDKTKTALKKRKRVGRACVHCQRSHMSCDDQRPCKRCVSRGCGDQCRDGKRKRRGRKRKYNNDEDELEDEDEFSSESELMSYSPVKPKRPKTQEPEEDVDVDGHACAEPHHHHHHPGHSCGEHPVHVHPRPVVAAPAPFQPSPSRFHQPQLYSGLAHPQPQVAAPALLHPQPSYSRMHTAAHPILKQQSLEEPVRDFAPAQNFSPIMALAPTPSPAPVERPATPHTPVPYIEHLNFAPTDESDLCVSGGWTMKLDKPEVDLDQYFHTDMVAQRAQLLSFNYEMDESSSSSEGDRYMNIELLA